jgi:hypothetical protein
MFRKPYIRKTRYSLNQGAKIGDAKPDLQLVKKLAELAWELRTTMWAILDITA